MKLDIGSIAFNLNIIDGGGTPSWGTSLGQNANYNYSVPGVEELLTSMLYCKIDEKSVFCPLGKGGNQQDNHSYELASLYNKVFVNGKLIPSARFVLLIVKKLEGDYHVGRRTLKYSPKITYNDDLINADCFSKMAKTLELNENSAWLVYSIHTQNQDELHFDVIVADKNNALEFQNSEDRKNYILNLLKEKGIESTQNSDEMKAKYKEWLINTGKFSDETIKDYVRYISNFYDKGITEVDLYTINNESIIDDLLYKLKNVDNYVEYNQQHNRNPYYSLLQYKNFKFPNSNNDLELSKIDLFNNYYNENIDEIKEKIKLTPNELIQEFLTEYPIEKFKEMTLEEYSMGLDDDSTFCRKVEGGKYKGYGVRCSGDPNGAAHWGIFYSKEKQSYLDSNYNMLENSEEYWNNFKNELYDYLNNLNDKNPKFSDSYPMLKNMSKTLPKLCFMYYPNKFLNFLTKGMLQELYDVFELSYTNNTPVDKLSYELNKYIRNNLPNAASEASEYISEVLWSFKESLTNMKKDKDNEEIIVVNDTDRLPGGYNKIYYGVPGSGKSHRVDEDFKNDEFVKERTTFHPDYTNSDFVGQIIPVVNDNKSVEYIFHPGAFTIQLEYALRHKNEKICLIIEEINRGNASSIFGDIFQLLDRDENGKSKYEIYNGPILDYLRKQGLNLDKVYIPSNMWIVATMNTSDQNVFTLDTAFKRRWKMEYIKNVFANNAESDELRNKIILNSDKYPNVTWEKFVKKINNHIISDTSGINGEDKQLGMYFVSIEEINNPKEFGEKILSYLWEDVAKINTSYWFGAISSYDELIETYNTNYLDVFNSIFDDDIAVTEDIMVKSIGE